MILALAILGVALATLGQAVGRSHENARRAADQAELAAAAASLLDEVLVGARPLTAIAEEPLADATDPTAEAGVLVSLTVEPGALEGLLTLRAVARPSDPRARAVDAVELVRWAVDPALLESTAASTAPGAAGGSENEL